MGWDSSLVFGAGAGAGVGNMLWIDIPSSDSWRSWRVVGNGWDKMGVQLGLAARGWALMGS